MNQKLNQNDFLKPVRIYWHNLKQLIISPNQFYSTRKPSTDLQFMLLSSLPPILLMAFLSACIAQKLWLALLYLVGAYAGMAILAVIERYLLLIFEEKRSFAEILDIVLTTCPAFFLGWIPENGLPMACLLVGLWNWKALSFQFKLEPGAALAGTALTMLLFGLFSLFIAVIVTVLSTCGQIFAH